MNDIGFSLLELLLALCIAAILAAIAYPCYRHIQQQQQHVTTEKQQHRNQQLLHQLRSTTSV